MKFKIRPAFEDFDFAASRSITKAQVKEVCNLKWVGQGRPLLLVGQTGVGKKFLAQAAAHSSPNPISDDPSCPIGAVGIIEARSAQKPLPNVSHELILMCLQKKAW